LTPPPDDEHDCGWKAYAKAQEEKLAELSAKLEALERLLANKKSERRKKGAKMPPPIPPKPDAAAAAAKRKQNAQARQA
jgi:hypothetical protein